MRWKELFSIHPAQRATQTSRAARMYGLQVHTKLMWDSGMKVVICTVAKKRLNNLADGSLNKWEAEWTHAKTSLWGDVHPSFLRPQCRGSSVVRGGEWEGREGTFWQRINQRHNVQRSRCWKSVMMEVCLQGFSQLLEDMALDLPKTVDGKIPSEMTKQKTGPSYVLLVQIVEQKSRLVWNQALPVSLD